MVATELGVAWLFDYVMHFSLSTSPKHKKEYSSDSSEKKYNLMHFRRISVLIELILAGKTKLSLASCCHIREQFD